MELGASAFGPAPIATATPAYASTNEAAASSTAAAAAIGRRCPEIVWRQVHWPQSVGPQRVYAACPAHAEPTLVGAQAAATAVSLACTHTGQWAARSDHARCQSVWLRNMTQRVESGDSPLALLNELVHRTQTHPSTSLDWDLALRTLPGASLAASAERQRSNPSSSLFGADLAQIVHIVNRLVDDDMSELLHRIMDNKQRSAFAREMLQVSYCYASCCC